MTWSQHVTLWCDGMGCGQWTDHGSRSVVETRRLAKTEGWELRRTAGHLPMEFDLCPFHVRNGRNVQGFTVHGDLDVFTDDRGLTLRTERIGEK